MTIAKRTVAGIVVGLSVGVALAQDPRLDSWETASSAQRAEVIEFVGGSPVTTWPGSGLPNMGGGQATPAYSDIQMIRYSATSVYINATGLASHSMGPWYISPGNIFGNWPSAQTYQLRIPRTPVVPGTKDPIGLGNIGIWVNGVGFYSGLDAFSYDTSGASDKPGAGGDGIWNRSAIAAEVATFDPAYAHQPTSGQYHYHANPKGLRAQLGDNLTYNSGSDTYTEASSGFTHSPILGWAFDGYPVYGPYGYSSALNSSSAIARMRSGYTLRNGTLGTTNLTSAGRHSLGAWAAALHGVTTTLGAAQYGPNVTVGRPIGWYAEDHDYLGDLGFTQGTDFDLDKYNGRFCHTPEYPAGTYAYFTTVDSGGNPVYPFALASEYNGDKTGGNAPTISESVTLLFENTGVASVNTWTDR